MALGAQRGNVLQMVLAQGVRLIVPGVVAGMVAALLVAYFMRSMLFGIRSWNPVIFVAVTAILPIVTLIHALYVDKADHGRGSASNFHSYGLPKIIKHCFARIRAIDIAQEAVLQIAYKILEVRSDPCYFRHWV
jgi:hypothetical protein